MQSVQSIIASVNKKVEEDRSIKNLPTYHSWQATLTQIMQALEETGGLSQEAIRKLKSAADKVR